jgi:hypothetical protein
VIVDPPKWLAAATSELASATPAAHWTAQVILVRDGNDGLRRLLVLGSDTHAWAQSISWPAPQRVQLGPSLPAGTADAGQTVLNVVEPPVH